MNPLHLTRPPRPIGVDVGSRVIKLAQLDVSGTRLIASARLPRAEAGAPVLSPGEAEMVAATIARRGFAGTDIAVAMHPAKLLSSVLELPPRSSGAPITEIARAEIARIQRVEADALEVGTWDLPSGPRAKPGDAPPAMVVACKREDADALLRPFDDAGLTCVHLDVSGPCVVNALRQSRPKDASVILDLGASAASSFVVLGRTPIFERRVPEAALSLLVSHVRETFELDNAGAVHVVNTVGCTPGGQLPGGADAARLVAAYADLVARELKTSLAYVAHRYPDLGIAEILLIGGGALIPGLAQHVSGASGIPARVPGWADIGVVPGARAEAPSELSLAIGLTRAERLTAEEAA